MTEKEFKKTKFAYGDKVKIKGTKGEHVIYSIEFEDCLIAVFDADAENNSSYTQNYRCECCTLIK